MREEIEVELSNPTLFRYYDLPDRFEYTFWKQADLDIAALTLTLHEGQRLKWFSERDIRRMDSQFAFNFKDILLDFYREKPWQRNPGTGH